MSYQITVTVFCDGCQQELAREVVRDSVLHSAKKRTGKPALGDAATESEGLIDSHYCRQCQGGCDAAAE